MLLLERLVDFRQLVTLARNSATESTLIGPIFCVHSKITMAGDEVPYYTVTALVPTLK